MSPKKALPAAALAALLLVPATHAAAPDSLTGSGPRIAADAAAALVAAPAAVTVIATDFAYEVPERMSGGVVTITLENRGSELHHAQLIRLEAGKTVEDMAASMAAGRMPNFVRYAGGPGATAPGMKSTVTLDLPAGTYYWICFIASPSDHVPHAHKGMVKRVEVVGNSGDPLPDVANTVILSDYAFEFEKPLRPGKQTIRVRNHAAQPHEITLAKLMPGKTLGDLLAWFEAGEQGPPPAIPLGGMQALDTGAAGDFEVTLEPGEYAALCFIPDIKDMKPHIAHGMVMQFTVE